MFNIDSILRVLPANYSAERSLRLLFIASTLALMTVAWFGITFGQARLVNFRAAINERSALLARQSQLEDQATDLQQQVQKARAECDQWVTRLPQQPSESEFLTLLSQAAEQAGVTLGDYRPGSVHTRQHAKEIELRLRASGPYAGLCQWLDNLDQLPRVLNIHHLTLIAPASPGGECSMDLQLMLLFGFHEKMD